MQELKICIYDAGARLGSILADRVYDLNRCNTRYFTIEQSDNAIPGSDSATAPSNLKDFINGGSAVEIR